MQIQNSIKYFKDCFLNDNRSGAITNVLSSEVERLYVIPEKEELLNNNLPYCPVPNDYLDDIEKELLLYAKEKELCYFSYLLIGMDEANGKNKKVVAPLFVFPAEGIRNEGLSYVGIDNTKFRFNAEVIRSLYNEEKHAADFNETVSEHFMAITDFSMVGSLIDTYFVDIDSTWLVDLPNLFDEKKIKKFATPAQIRKRTCKYLLVPASGIGLIKRQGETVGVLNELIDLTKQSDFSAPLDSLLTGREFPVDNYEKGQVPNILSNPQCRAVEAASKYPLSLIVGPPGTGKSYTIATLAIEHFSKGKSVLIASRTDQAVNVVANKIERELDLRNVVIRAGRRQYMKDLKITVQDILNGVNVDNRITINDVKLLAISIEEIRKKIRKIENEFLKISHFERKWGLFLSESQTTFFDRLKRIYITRKGKRNELAWKLIADLEHQLDVMSGKIQKYITSSFDLQKKVTLNNYRKELKLLLQAFRARTGVRKEGLFEQIDQNVLLKTFPIWLVNMKDIYKVLPLQKEMFDLAIIDEATQCDIASCLPIFQRAKRVVVTGDPKQLRHVSFLSRSIQNRLFAKHLSNGDANAQNPLYDYRKSSILDAVSDGIKNQEQVSFLNEHFRSTPAIIRFSNRHIYNNALHVMTEKPDIPTNKGLEILTCNGIRNNDGANVEEVMEIFDKINQIYESSKTLPLESRPSIGILSPLRSQVEYIKLAISGRLHFDIFEKHKLLIGTAYEFQGEERDIMFISLCVDDNSHPMAFHHLSKPDVFNVSITRARSMQYVYRSFDASKLANDNLAKRYICQTIEEQRQKTEPKINKDEFLDEVSSFLLDKEMKVWKAHEIAGIKIDIMAQRNNKPFGIDLIGYPGEFEDAFTIERYKILRRAKLPIMPLPYSAWKFQREKCEEAILEFCS